MVVRIFKIDVQLELCSVLFLISVVKEMPLFYSKVVMVFSKVLCETAFCESINISLYGTGN